MLQFYFTQDIFGSIGLKPSAESKQASKEAAAENTPPNVIRDRIIAVLIFSVFTVFFWAFEQAGGSMTIFAEKYTQRELFE
jgi:POT family proton-dependent oligopeptide transporter